MPARRSGTWTSVGINAEVIDPIWLESARYRHDRRLGPQDRAAAAWSTTAGPPAAPSAEIVAGVVERLQGARAIAIRRLGFAPVTCPTTPVLESLFYPNARTIASAAYDLVHGGTNGWLPEEQDDLKEIEFQGPF